MLQQLNHLWRLFGTALCFSFFGIGGIILALTLLPDARLWPGSTKQRDFRTRNIVHRSFQFFVWLLDFTRVITVQVKGLDQLKKTRGQLVIANHPSLIDVVILVACIPNCCCIVKQALWNNPFLGGVVRWTGYISNSDPEKLIDQCQETLNSGSSIVVFPEGTRTIDPKQLKFQRGSASIAARCLVDIQPVTIYPDPPTLRKGEPWYQLPARRSIFSVEVLEKIAVKDIVDPSDELPLATRKLNRYLQDFYQSLINQNGMK